MALEHGNYLHNRWSLFRFEEFLPDGEGVVLEDCWSGVVSIYSLEEFTKMKLTKVRREMALADRNV